MSALWVLPAKDPAPKPTASGAVVAIAPAVALATNAERTAWRVDFSITRPTKGEVYVDYALPGAAKNWFAVPSAGLPLPPDAHIIYNLVSSPIVHAPPSKLAIFALKLLDKDLEIGRDIEAKMLKLPGADARYLAQRNWLRLRADALGVINAEWWVESKDPAKDVMYAKPINPVA